MPFDKISRGIFVGSEDAKMGYGLSLIHILQKKKATAEAEIDREKLNVDMYALNGRVNDLYFGILMLDEQLAQNALLQDELGRNFRQITAYVDNGIANQADLDAVKVEQLNTRQKRVCLLYTS